MIVVKVELHSARTGKVENIGELIIANDGRGSASRGNYDGWILRRGGKGALYNRFRDIIKGRRKAVRTGRVEDYAREENTIWYLIAKMLKAMDYE